MKKLLLILFIIGMILPIVMADTYKLNEELDFKITCSNNGTYCTSGSECNITVFYPNNTILINNEVMGYHINYHNYTIQASDISILGKYSANVVCIDGLYKKIIAIPFEITYNGKESPTAWIIISFFILFMAIVMGLILTLLMIVRDFGDHNIDAFDVFKYLGLYLSLIAFNYFSQEYLGNKLVDRVLGIFIPIGAFTHVLIPFTGFAVSLIINTAQNKLNKRMGNG